MRTWKGIIAVLALLIARSAFAQVQPYTGKDVPDVAAVRLWLESHCGAQLQKVDPNPAFPDAVASLTGLCASFQPAYNQLLSAFNKAPGAQWPNAAHYTMVTNLLNSFVAGLSVQQQSRFADFLQRYKADIRLSPYDWSLGPLAERNLKETSMFASSHAMPGMMQGNMTPNYSVVYAHGLSFPNLYYSVAFPASGPLGSNWTCTSGGFHIASYTVDPNGDASDVCYYNQAPSSTINISSWSVAGLPINGAAIGVLTRVQPSSQTYYAAWVYNSGTGPSTQIITLYKVTNGTDTWLNQYSTGGSANIINVGDNLAIYANSFGYVSVSINGVYVMDATDPSPLPSGYPGIGARWGTTGGFNAFKAASDLQLYASSYISGNTICGGGGCPQGAKHTAQATVTYAGQGGTVYGPQVLPQTATSAQNIETFDMPGAPGSIEMDGGVACTAVGSIFSNSFTRGGWIPVVEDAVTMNQVGVTSINNNTAFPLTDWTSRACQPPDFEPTVWTQWDPRNGQPSLPQPWEPYIKSKAPCVMFDPEFIAHWDCAPANDGPWPLNWLFGEDVKAETTAQALRNATANGDGLHFDSTNYLVHKVNSALCKGVWSDPPVN